ncbi:MAG: OmpA family protein [Lutibacter sp.]|uniref:OmpA family protein n=1 Tax=Lutibacter sp. TaxID=1925666 RepID=UPI0038580070
MKKVFIILVMFISILNYAQDKQERYSIKNLAINNAYSNFGTSFFGTDKMIFAAPTKRSFIINNTWKPNGQPFLDLFEGTVSTDGEITNVKKFSSNVNTKYHEADVTFTRDKKTVYFSRSNYFNGKYKKDTLGINRIQMYKATVGPNNEWTNIENLPFNNDNYSTGQPTISEDGKTLYFVSDMPGTFGKTDIFKVAVNDDGTYGKPINLGTEVNTADREMFPFIDGNNDLYYSTNGRPDGRGMLDIYVNRITSDGILPAVNLGDNMNSERDDFAFIIDKDKRSGYFSSNRFGGKGDDDIYYFHEEIPLVYECDQTITIIVKSKKTRDVIPNANINIYNGTALLVEGEKNNDKGEYVYNADCETTYKIEASKKYYITTSKVIKTSNKNKINQNVELFLPVDEFIVLRDKVMIDVNSIYFDYDKFNIRRDAALELDKVVAIMEKYPKLIVESGSHTDSRGPDRYNMVLSDKRAKSTVDYIISRGISPERITGKGYGETQLTNRCSNGVRCSEEEHQLNRRTEFVIVNPEVIN